MKKKAFLLGSFVIALICLLLAGYLSILLFTGIFYGPYHPATDYRFRVGYDAWSPDSSRLVFMDLGTSKELYVLDLQELLVKPIAPIDNGFNITQIYAWSYDSKQLVYTQGGDKAGHDRLYLVDSKGNHSRLLHSDCPGVCWYPVWSPDQTAIGLFTLPPYWCTGRECSPYSLVVFDLEMSSFHEFTLSKPDWFPIAPVSTNSDENFDFYRKLTNHLVNEVISPDGELIAVQDRNNIYIKDTKTHKVLFIVDINTVYRTPLLGATLLQAKVLLGSASFLGGILCVSLLKNRISRSWMAILLLLFSFIWGVSFLCDYVGLPD